MADLLDFRVFLDLKGLVGNNSLLPMTLAFDLNGFFVNLFPSCRSASRQLMRLLAENLADSFY